jgi:hypothetical protein
MKIPKFMWNPKNTEIYVESEEVGMPQEYDKNTTRSGRTTRGGDSSEVILQKFRSMQDTIKAYTTYTLNAFRGIADANIDKVKLEFGIKVGAEGGIPYVTKGKAESNLSITVECSFPKK